MVHIVLISHGELAEGLKKSTEMIIGDLEYQHVLILQPGMSHKDILDQIMNILEQLTENDQMLILLDLFGGSPAIACVKAMQEDSRIEAVTGANLPMLLEVFMNRTECSVMELAAIASERGKEGIVDLRKSLA